MDKENIKSNENLNENQNKFNFEYVLDYKKYKEFSANYLASKISTNIILVLILVALILNIGAFVIKEYFEGVMVMLLFQIGEYINDASILYSKDKINNLVKNKKIYVTLKKENKEYKVRPELIKKGDIFYVKPGEKIYIDGIIIDGNSSINTSFITGEAKDTKVSVNDEIISGSINNAIKKANYY